MKYQNKFIMEKHNYFAWKNQSGLVLGLDTAQKADVMNAKGAKGHPRAPGPLPAHTTPVHDQHLSILLLTTCQLPSPETLGKALALAEGATISRERHSAQTLQ